MSLYLVLTATIIQSQPGLRYVLSEANRGKAHMSLLHEVKVPKDPKTSKRKDDRTQV